MVYSVFMSRSLNPQSLANMYTLEQISAKIVIYQDALDSAVVKEYKKDSTQGSIDVESSDMDKIESVLAVWVEAYNIKSGNGGMGLVSASFNKRRFM